MAFGESFAARVQPLLVGGKQVAVCPHCQQLMPLDGKLVVWPGYGLTEKQAELYHYLKRRLADPDRASPSFDEMLAHMGVRSKSGIHRLLKALEERGLIRRLPNRARSIQLVGAA